jgi:hypothetical protein
MGGERSLAPEGTPFTSTDVSPADLPTRRTLLQLRPDRWQGRGRMTGDGLGGPSRVPGPGFGDPARG